MSAQAPSEGRITVHLSGFSCAREPASMAHLRHVTARSPADASHVLSIRARVKESELPSFIRDALHEIGAYIKAHHVEVQGPPFSVHDPASPHGIDVEVGWPVVGWSHGAGRIASGVLPTVLLGRHHDRTCAASDGRHPTARSPAAEGGAVTSDRPTERREPPQRPDPRVITGDTIDGAGHRVGRSSPRLPADGPTGAFRAARVTVQLVDV